MKNYHILFIILIAILLVGGGVLVYKDLTKPSVPGNNVDNQNVSKIKDFGTDFSDFIVATKNCPLAKVKWVADVDFLGAATEKIQHEIELQGLNSEQKCIFIDKNTVVGFKFKVEALQKERQEDSTLTDDKIKQMEEDAMLELKNTVEATYTCYFDTNYMTQMLDNWSKGVVVMNDFTSNNCTGVDRNGKNINLLGENNTLDLSNAKMELYLVTGASSSYGDFSIKANSITVDSANITITYIKTGESKTVLLKKEEFTNFLGKKISVLQFQKRDVMYEASITIE